jgi:hypothetical protein
MEFRSIYLSVCHYAGYPQATTVDILYSDTAGLWVKDGLLFQAERRLRPFALRLRITSRPSRVDILVKKPWARWCLILLGW